MRISDWSSDVCSSDLLSEVPPADPPRLFLLGTAGGPIPRQERSQPANALVIGGQVYLIDAGDGLLRQMAAKRLNLGAVRALFLTHHHIDHIADVPVLMIRSEEHTSELQSLMRISYAVFCLKKKKQRTNTHIYKLSLVNNIT